MKYNWLSHPSLGWLYVFSIWGWGNVLNDLLVTQGDLSYFDQITSLFWNVPPRYFMQKSFVQDSLQWCHDGHDGISDHQPHYCLLNRLFRRRSKRISKLRITGLCAGNSQLTGEFPHKGPVMRKMFPFDDIILLQYYLEFIRTGDISVVHWTLSYVLLLHGYQNWIGRILQWVNIIHSKMSQVLYMRQ